MRAGRRAARAGLDECTGAQNRGTAANERAGKSFVELAEHSRGFHRLLHALTELSPAAGLGLIAAFSGPQAAVMGLILLVRALKSGEEEAAKAAVEFAKEAGKGWGDVEAVINGVLDAVMKSDQAHGDWAKHLGEDNKAITTALDGQIGKLKAEAAAVKEVIEAMHAARLVRLEADKEAGKLTPEQYAAQKARIEADQRAGREGVEGTVGKAEMVMTRAAHEKAKKEAEEALQAANEAHDASESLGKKINASALKAKAEADSKEADRLKEAMLGAQAVRGEAQIGPGRCGTIWHGLLNLLPTMPGRAPIGQAIENRALWDAEQAEDKATKDYYDRLKLARKESRGAAQAEKDQGALDEEAARSKAKAEAAAGQERELKSKMAALEASVGAGEAGRGRANAMRSLGELGPTPFGKQAMGDVDWASEIARKLASGKASDRAGVTAADEARLMQYGSRIAGGQVSLATGGGDASAGGDEY